MTFKKRDEGMHFTVCEDYRELSKEWYDLIPEDHFLHPYRVATAQKSELPDLNYRYVITYYENKLVSFSYFQLLDVKPKHIHLPSPVWNALAQTSLRIMRPRLLVCGHLFRHDITTVYFTDRSLSQYMQAKIMYTTCTQMLKQCGISALLLKDLPRSYNSYLLHHAPKCKAMKEDISMKMNLCDQWENFDDYLSSLKHKYKQRAKKVRKKAGDMKLKKLSLEDVTELQDEIQKSYQSLLDRQMVKLGTINTDFLKHLMSHNEEFSIYGIFDAQDESYIGFFSCFERKNELDMFYIGYRQELNQKHSLYFNILYWGLEKAIENRCQLLNLGRTALDPKASLGCDPSYSQNYYRIKNRLLNLFSRRSQNRYLQSQGEVWEIRRPFNNEYYQIMQKQPVGS